MKKTILMLTVILSIVLFAGCSSQKVPESESVAAESSGSMQTDTPAADTSAEEKQTADASSENLQTDSSTEEQSAAENPDDGEEKTMTGTLDEVKDFMFVVRTEDDCYYAFAFDEKPEGLDDLKAGDSVTVTYTGTVTEIDPFTGTIISVEKAE